MSGFGHPYAITPGSNAILVANTAELDPAFLLVHKERIFAIKSPFASVSPGGPLISDNFGATFSTYAPPVANGSYIEANNLLFIAYAASGRPAFRYSSDRGNTWSAEVLLPAGAVAAFNDAPTPSFLLTSIHFVAGTYHFFVAISDSTGTSDTGIRRVGSTDLATFSAVGPTLSTGTAPPFFPQVNYALGKFFIAYLTFWRYSTDGDTWLVGPTRPTLDFGPLTVGPDEVVEFRSNTSGMRSSDLVNWTAFNPGQFVPARVGFWHSGRYYMKGTGLSVNNLFTAPTPTGPWTSLADAATVAINSGGAYTLSRAGPWVLYSSYISGSFASANVFKIL